MRKATKYILKNINGRNVFGNKDTGIDRCPVKDRPALIDEAITNCINIVIACAAAADDCLIDGALKIESNGHTHETASNLVKCILNIENREEAIEESIIDMLRSNWADTELFLVKILKFCPTLDKINYSMAWRCQPWADLIHWHCKRHGGHFSWENGSINASKIMK